VWKYEHYICALGVGRARDRSRVIAPVDAVVAGTRLIKVTVNLILE
jgi:hypothetical protein